MKLTLTGYLLAGLALSAGANGFLAWRLSNAAQRCETEKTAAKLQAVEAERDRAAKEDRKAAEIAAETKSETQDAVFANETEANEREQQIRTVVVHGDCRMPAGLPSLQPAINAANAAARD